MNTRIKKIKKIKQNVRLSKNYSEFELGKLVDEISEYKGLLKTIKFEYKKEKKKISKNQRKNSNSDENLDKLKYNIDDNDNKDV